MTADEHSRTEVVIVGGGPVGMLLAAELALQKTAVTIIETRTDLDERPRAGTVHARSVSHLARRGYLPSVRADEIARHAGAVRRTQFQFAAQPVLSITAPAVEPAPIAGIPQARLEAAFEQRASSSGARILRGHTVTAIRTTDDEVAVDIEPLDGSAAMTIVAGFVVGADGARSLVARHGGLPAHTYPATMNAIAGLARTSRDDLPPPGWHPTNTGWTLHNPNPGAPTRIIGLDFSGPAQLRETPTEREYLDDLGTILGTPPMLDDISHLTRFSDFGRYRTRMRAGRLLVVGDAAHVHYPLGGQGLNTGMQDAFTLGWRLARVIAGTTDACVLDDWSRERVWVARTVVGNTVLQSRMMNPATTDIRDAVIALLGVPAVHDAVAEVISGQFQPGFQTDLVITEDDGAVHTLAELLTAGRHVAIRPDESISIPGDEPGQVVVTGKVTPEQPWVSALVRPDGYLAHTA
ncbi:FAD-dependent monooxygenase [Gordonia sp. ABSL11-1]|uniref:FAD-dependent monooxygenase n=1 Tax=Gordonia sp. ABSL11-1 TaxID=3053924 RepID=UPI002573C58A|nr:FAD-dependent monooxygenase [Gordonia sp. ABSL11-1]MDL9947943.1 FAD-dependent monooxygenase [Gordonia sp. ABSL11-1]